MAPDLFADLDRALAADGPDAAVERLIAHLHKPAITPPSSTPC